MNIKETDFVQLVAKINNKLTGYENKHLQDKLAGMLSSYQYHETDKLQIASIIRSLIKNHYFVDGNKRTAAVAMFTLADVAGIKMSKDDNEYIDIICDIAAHQYDVDKIASMIFDISS